MRESDLPANGHFLLKPYARPLIEAAFRQLIHSGIDIDNGAEEYRRALRKTTDLSAIERINNTITELYADRVRLHQNPPR